MYADYTFTMRLRNSFLLHPGEPGIDPSTVEVGHDYVKLPPVKAAEEWKATLALNELPEEVCCFSKLKPRFYNFP